MTRAPALLASLLVATVACADGVELYAGFCQRCHGENPEPVRHFAGTRADFQDILEGAREGMPDFFGVFTDEEVDALYDYVKQLGEGCDNCGES